MIKNQGVLHMVVQGNLNVTGQFLCAHLSHETIEVSEICAEILVNPSRRRNAGPEIDLIWLHHINADNVVDVGTRFREELYRISSSEFLIFVLANAIEKLISEKEYDPLRGGGFEMNRPGPDLTLIVFQHPRDIEVIAVQVLDQRSVFRNDDHGTTSLGLTVG